MITRETRAEAYREVLPKVNKRSRLILDTLKGRKMTVSEIAEELLRRGEIAYFNRNFVAPRLTELSDAGLVRTIGKRKATRSDRNEAVYEVAI